MVSLRRCSAVAFFKLDLFGHPVALQVSAHPDLYLCIRPGKSLSPTIIPPLIKGLEVACGSFRKAKGVDLQPLTALDQRFQVT